MKVYFVRHGESILNQQEIHQNGKVRLSNEGLKQAKKVAKRFQHVPVDVIISSSFIRAHQTAHEIGKKLNQDVITSELFVEFKRPTGIEGRSLYDPEVMAIKKKIVDNWHDPQWRYEDEETFYDIRDRAQEAIANIVARKDENILVVLHGQILRMMIAIMLFGKDVTIPQFQSMQRFLHLSNTGVTVCTYTENQWSLLTFNDHSHLS